jgi:hypothetical protein
MPRARTPKAKAVATGRVLHDPKRFEGRNEPTVDRPLGDPPSYMKTDAQIEAWNAFADELGGWLNRSHRALVGIASEIRGRQIAGEEVGVKALSLLRQCLGQLGATPSDVSKVTMPAEKPKGDPADKYF